MAKRPFPEVRIENRAEWRQWLDANHGQQESVWAVWRRKSAGGGVAANELVEEALCFGWIDSLPRKRDEAYTMLLFSPRKAGSNWSAVNKARVEKLNAAGLMAPAGLSAVERSHADGSWSALDAVSRLDIPEDLALAFAARPGSRENWEDFPPSVRRGILEWILNAKTATTRQKRVAETAAKSAKGERANQWR